MEEIVGSLQEFLFQIAQSEQQIDGYRAKISQITCGKQTIFHTINTNQNPNITVQDVCNFCSENGIKELDQQVLEKYFQFKNGEMGLNQFCHVMLPHKNYQNLPQSQNSVQLFLEMINKILESFVKIEEERLKLCSKKSEIEKFFHKYYGTENTLSKKILRQFMHQQCMYQFFAFFNICLYIYGQDAQEITFEELLSEKPLIIEPINLKQDDDETELKLQTKIQMNEKDKRSYDLNEVLEQINNIQKTMREKKKGTENQINIDEKQSEKKIKMVKLDEPSQENTYQNNELAGKIVSRKYRYGPIHDAQVEYKRPQYSPLVYRDTWVPYSGKVEKSLRKSHDGPFLHKSSSQAQLKIKEIQKKAMAKYNNYCNGLCHMHDHVEYRNINHLPDRTYEPYAHQAPKYKNFTRINYDFTHTAQYFKPRYARY